MIQRSTGSKSQDSPETPVDEATVPTSAVNDDSPVKAILISELSTDVNAVTLEIDCGECEQPKLL